MGSKNTKKSAVEEFDDELPPEEYELQDFGELFKDFEAGGQRNTKKLFSGLNAGHLLHSYSRFTKMMLAAEGTEDVLKVLRKLTEQVMDYVKDLIDEDNQLASVYEALEDVSMAGLDDDLDEGSAVERLESAIENFISDSDSAVEEEAGEMETRLIETDPDAASLMTQMEEITRIVDEREGEFVQKLDTGGVLEYSLDPTKGQLTEEAADSLIDMLFLSDEYSEEYEEGGEVESKAEDEKPKKSSLDTRSAEDWLNAFFS